MIWRTRTESNCAEFRPPAGQILGVSYEQQDYPTELAFFFIAQESVPMWHAASANGQPSSIEEVKQMLQGIHDVFHLPCWTTFGGQLVIWPPALNDGDLLVVEIADAVNNN